MDNFTFYAPTYFDFGKGAEKHVADLIKKFGGHKVLLHYGGGSIKKTGLYDAVVSEIKKVTWPTKKQVVSNTLSVLAFCLVVGAIIWLADFGLKSLMSLITRLS